MHLEKYIGWNPEEFHCSVRDLVQKCLRHMMLAQINRQVRPISLPWLHTQNHFPLRNSKEKITKAKKEKRKKESKN